MMPTTVRALQQTEPREGVWNPNGEGEQPFVPGGNAKDEARAKQPVIAYACLYPKLAAIAREHGYALAMHGSLVADCDLIAVAWVAEAASHDTLAAALAKRAGGYLILDQWTEPRPAGVRKHIIHLGGGPYLDLAVVPLQSDLLATVRALQQQQTWQLIESAPKDGRMLLLFPARCWCDESDCGEVGYWDPDVQAWEGAGGIAEDYTGPTHWMPLPGPPVALQEPLDAD